MQSLETAVFRLSCTVSLHSFASRASLIRFTSNSVELLIQKSQICLLLQPPVNEPPFSWTLKFSHSLAPPHQLLKLFVTFLKTDPLLTLFLTNHYGGSSLSSRKEWSFSGYFLIIYSSVLSRLIFILIIHWHFSDFSLNFFFSVECALKILTSYFVTFFFFILFFYCPLVPSGSSL